MTKQPFVIRHWCFVRHSEIRHSGFTPMLITILYNEPVLPPDHPDYVSEAGVLESVDAFVESLGQHNQRLKRLAIGHSLAEFVAELSADRPDVVVNFCEGFAGHSRGEAYIAGLLELLGVPYTGCSPECLVLAHDKLRTKQALAAAGVPTAPYWHVPRDSRLRSLADAEKLRDHLRHAPLFVKPAAEDASLGIDDHSVVEDWESLERKVHDVQTRYGDALVEPYLDGREFNVGVIALPDPRVLPIAEIEFHTSEEFPWPIVTYQSKWTSSSQAYRATPVRCPADVSPDLAERIQAVALAAFQAVGCRDYARVDLRLTRAGELFVLEVNANPDASPSAGLTRALEAASIPYDEFAVRLVETAARRQGSLSPWERAGVRGSRNDILLNTSQPAISIRTFESSDRHSLLEILAACEMFRPDEIEVADEILTEAIRDGAGGHYQVLVAELDGQRIGWSCHGRVPLTDGTYDLYWIAVHPDYQRQRIGHALLAETATLLRRAGARWLLAETSSTAKYDKTRNFYERAGFTILGNVPDFYRASDGRITFGKRIEERPGPP
jgi:D-alanine-D-alanine ligase